MSYFNISASERQDFVEETCTELSVYLGMLYFLIEIFKGDEEFGDELSIIFFSHKCLLSEYISAVSLDPPLPIYIINLLGSLKERSAKGYPMKKVCSLS